ncbi:MAG: DUF6090 family protein [Psychroserpens sp.]|uniref:DUF6090 family protein n=1 Tax=Psychroserpens sp. TaxID=2020870 RepID=UPI0030025925
MIKFFRKIRQNLISENKVSKYLLYAIGEIVLVVIGILIALQINNWNTQKNEENELNGFLRNIKKNVVSDLQVLNEIETFRDSTLAYSERYLELYKNHKIEEKAPIDEIIGLGTIVFQDRYFYSNKSGFDALKNSGYLSKIQATKLEDYLNAYYFKVDRIIEQEKSLNNFIENMQVLAYGDNSIQELLKFYSSNNYSSLSLEDKNKFERLYNHPGISGANLLNTFMSQIPIYYNELRQEAEQIINEIDAIQKE